MFLIADDSPGKIMMLQALLKKAHWNEPLLIAKTTEEAMALIDQHPDIAFAFIDYYIPSERGPAIIRYLKEKIPSAHIALVSSADNAENNKEAMDAGAEVCLCTTRESDEVEKTVLDLLEQWKS